MEEKTRVSDDVIRPEGASDPDVPYISPEIAAARAGETVEFDMRITNDA